MAVTHPLPDDLVEPTRIKLLDRLAVEVHLRGGARERVGDLLFESLSGRAVVATMAIAPTV